MRFGERLFAGVDEFKDRRNIKRRWKRARLRGWHDHFLIFPAFVNGYCLTWLETVERRYVPGKWHGEGFYEYREK